MTYPTEVLIDKFDRMARGEDIERSYVEVFERFGYCKDGKIVVPVYNTRSYDIADELYRFGFTPTRNEAFGDRSWSGRQGYCE